MVQRALTSSRPARAWREWLPVAAAFAVLALVATVWLALDRHPPEWDHANHLERAAVCRRDLAAGDVRAVIERSAFYPPVVPCVAGLVSGIVGSDLLAAQLTMLGFLALGMASIYAIGRARHGVAVGALAAIIFGSAPFVVFNTVRFQLDLPVAALVALVTWLAVRSDGFGRRGWAVAAGVAVGVGLLVKPPFPLYVVPALVWAIARGRGPLRFANAALAAGAALAVSIAWYGPRLMALPAQVSNRSFRQAAESGHPDPLSWAGLMTYPLTLPTFLGLAASVLFAAGLVVAWRRRCGLELAAVLLPFAVFLLIQNKNARYTLPILPMVSVVAALALDATPSRLRRLAVAVTLVVAALQVSATAFALPARVEIPGTSLAVAIPAPPAAEDWRHREILDAIARHAGNRPGATVSIVPNHAWFSTSNFRYYAVRDRRPLRIVRAWDQIPVGIDYMVLKTGDQGPLWTEAKSRRVMARLEADPDLARIYPVVAQTRLPDGSTATLRARDPGAGVDVPPDAMASRLAETVRRGLDDVARDVENLAVRVDHDARIVRGYVRRLEIAADVATVGELRKPRSGHLTVHDFAIVIDGLVVSPWSVAAVKAFEPLDAVQVSVVRASIRAADLERFLAELKGFERTRVRFERDALWFTAALPGPDVSARVRVVAAPGRPFALDAADVRLGGVPVPALLVNWVFRNFDPSARLADRLPVPVEIGRVRVTPDAVRIGD